MVSLNVTPRSHSAVQNRKAVTAYFISPHLPHFGFAQQYRLESHIDNGILDGSFIEECATIVFRPANTLIDYWPDVGPPSLTLAQHDASTGSMCRVCWARVRPCCSGCRCRQSCRET